MLGKTVCNCGLRTPYVEAVGSPRVQSQPWLLRKKLARRGGENVKERWRMGGEERGREERKSKPLDNSSSLPLVLHFETLSRVSQAGLNSCPGLRKSSVFCGGVDGTEDFPHARQALCP